jgi:hypothetical protein
MNKVVWYFFFFGSFCSCLFSPEPSDSLLKKLFLVAVFLCLKNIDISCLFSYGSFMGANYRPIIYELSGIKKNCHYSR